MLCSNCQSTTDLLQKDLAWWTQRRVGSINTSLLFRHEVPDGVWLRLHPAPPMDWFRLVIDIDEAALAHEKTRRLF